MNHHHDPDEILKSASLKVTEQRRVILRFLLHNHGPFTVEEMKDLMSEGSFDLATLYRSMATFEEAGLVEKRLFGDGLVRWEYHAHSLCGHDHHTHHHHLMCHNCKSITTLDVCLPPEFFKIIEAYNYTHLKHHLEFSGLCPACQKKEVP